MTEIQQAPSAETRSMLAALHAAAFKTLQRKYRLGQYAVVWQDGKPVRLEKTSELDFLRSERTYLRHALAELPESARLTRLSDEARLQEVQARIAALGGE